MAVKLNAKLIESFAGTFLSPLYDNPKPTPDLHRDCWDLYSKDDELVAVAAPRGHAKSTALTHDFILAVTCFRAQDFVVLISATEDLAIGHLGDIAKEFRENDDLRSAFMIERLTVDAKTDIVVVFKDGHQVRIIAKGSGQKMRGLKWNGKRPGLIICDDLEEDEQVQNKARREEFARWFYRAVLPCRRQGGWVRVHGTILHEASLLAHLMKSKVWKSKLFRAHKSFDDFSEVLWPEQFPENVLKNIRQAYIDRSDAAGYSQEYLNDPRDNSEAYLRSNDFIPMKEEDYETDKVIRVGCDFAVSKADHADRTSFTVGGKDTNNIIHIIDQYTGRWDPTEWLEVMFDIESRYSPAEFLVEGGVIWKAIEPIILSEMRRRDLWMNLRVINPTRDKAARGRPLQKRHRSGGMRFDKSADWYAVYEDELLRFTAGADAVHDDQFDSTAIMVKGFEDAAEVDEEDFYSDDDIEMMYHDPRKLVGRSATTGY